MVDKWLQSWCREEERKRKKGQLSRGTFDRASGGQASSIGRAALVDDGVAMMGKFVWLHEPNPDQRSPRGPAAGGCPMRARRGHRWEFGGTSKRKLGRSAHWIVEGSRLGASAISLRFFPLPRAVICGRPILQSQPQRDHNHSACIEQTRRNDDASPHFPPSVSRLFDVTTAGTPGARNAS